MKIAIVNRLLETQELIKRVISLEADYEIIWTACEGQEALKKTVANRPDIILMDLDLELCGVEVTRLIMESSPCAIIIVTAIIDDNSNLIYEAMGYGAMDVVGTPRVNERNEIEGADLLMEKIEQVGRIIGKINTPIQQDALVSVKIGSSGEGKRHSIILIGASTGGPQALVDIFSELPPNFSVPIVVVQHVDSEFAPGLASWLNTLTSLAVQVATHGVKPERGNVYIAATKDHLIWTPEGRLQYSPEPLDMVYRPSVDVLFKSFARHYDSIGIAVLLTGMGQDGAEGMLMLRNKGWLTIAQDKDSSILFGMPKAAIEQNAAIEVLPLKSIPEVILSRVVGV